MSITGLIVFLRSRLIRSVITNRLSYLSPEALYELKKTITKIEDLEVKGLFIEAGCALGGSAIVIGQAKRANRPFNVYDVFGMIPEPSSEDGKDVFERYEIIKNGTSKGILGGTYYGYKSDLIEEVKNNFEKFNLPLVNNNIHLIQGLYEDTLIIDEPVAFAHIDCDWYASVITCLKQIVPNLAENGVIIVDDYNSWSGCRKAVNDYFQPVKGFQMDIKKGKLHITRYVESCLQG